MKKNNKKKVFVMISGGVDSSVAALLLKKRGYQVIGCFIKGFNVDGCQEKDLADARRVAETLKIPFYVIDLEKEYKEKIVDYLIKTYQKGETPNPDVLCNKEIKFGLFFDKAKKLGADFIASGHYVRKIKRGNQYFLYQAKDKNKDQSYFLWAIDKDKLKDCLFPIGCYLKSEVRAIARKANLLTAEKKDSQGICFLGKLTLKDFLSQYLKEKKGLVLTTSGKVIGCHPGIFYFTIGQRHGLGISFSKPLYIAEKDIKKNILKVAEGKNHPTLFKKEIEVQDINLFDNNLVEKITSKKPFQIKIFARVRYRQPLFKANLIFDGKKTKLVFEKPQQFVALGQSAVFYQNQKMIGGGIIKKAK